MLNSNPFCGVNVPCAASGGQKGGCAILPLPLLYSAPVLTLCCCDVSYAQLQNESLTSVLKKVEAEAQFVGKQIEATVEKQQRLQEVGGWVRKQVLGADGARGKRCAGARGKRCAGASHSCAVA